MDRHRFDAVIRAFAAGPSRRTLLRDLAGLSLGLGATRLPGAVEARKKRRRKKGKKNKRKKSKPNAFGCLSVGAFCKNATQCCSGICTGKKGKRTCRAHDTGTCRQDIDGYCQSASPTTTLCNNRNDCVCVRTTSGSNVCAEGYCGVEGCSECAECTRDADCIALGYPPEAACAQVVEGLCAGGCPGGMACMLPCRAKHPAPPPTP